MSSVIASQDDVHRPFGGVVPEIAARAHMQKIDHIIAQAIKDAGCDYTDLSAIAATSGPGLIGGVIAGLMSAKGLAMALGLPLVAVNHLEGHALSPRVLAIIQNWAALSTTRQGKPLTKPLKSWALAFPAGPRSKLLQL